MKHDHTHAPKDAIGLAAVLNLCFAVSEFIAGFLFRSTALLSDAVHDTGDVLALVLSAIMNRLSRKNPTQAYSYGFGRLSLLTAVLNSAVLLLGAGFVVKEAWIKLIQPEPVNSLGMFLMSILGIIANFYAVTGFKGNKNILSRSVMLHLIEDLLGWLAVFVCSIIIYFTGWYILDPVLSLGIALFITVNAVRNLKQSCQMVMMRTSDLGELAELSGAITELAGVTKIFDVHYWSLDGEHQILTAKVELEAGSNQLMIREQITKLSAPYAVVCSTIEFIKEED